MRLCIWAFISNNCAESSLPKLQLVILHTYLAQVEPTEGKADVYKSARNGKYLAFLKSCQMLGGIDTDGTKPLHPTRDMYEQKGNSTFTEATEEKVRHSGSTGKTLQKRTTSSLRIENPLCISAGPFLLCQDRTTSCSESHSQRHMFQSLDACLSHEARKEEKERKGKIIEKVHGASAPKPCLTTVQEGKTKNQDSRDRKYKKTNHILKRYKP